MTPEKPHVTRAEIAAGLRRLGLRRGDRTCVHSSLSAFGFVEGGARAVILALLDVLGAAGTLMMPTFNQGKVDVFDRGATPSFNGRITETFRRMPGVERSLHPTHAYAAVGPDAERYLTGAELQIAWGPDSPLGRLIADTGWVLLLGVSHGSSTAQHHGETAARIKCFGLDTAPAWYLDDEGELTPAVAPAWRSGRCPYTPAEHEKRLRHLRAVRDGWIGPAHVHLMRGAETVKAVCELVGGKTGVDHCATCPQYPDVDFYETFRAEHPHARPSKGDDWSQQQLP